MNFLRFVGAFFVAVTLALSGAPRCIPTANLIGAFAKLLEKDGIGPKTLTCPHGVSSKAKKSSGSQLSDPRRGCKCSTSAFLAEAALAPQPSTIAMPAFSLSHWESLHPKSLRSCEPPGLDPPPPRTIV